MFASYNNLGILITTNYFVSLLNPTTIIKVNLKCRK